MSESTRNSDIPNMLDSQQLFANTKKMTELITEELKSRGYEPRELSDDQLRKVIQKAPKTATRLEQITDNVLRPADREGTPSLIKDYPIGEAELFDQFANPIGSEGIASVLFGLVNPAKKLEMAKKAGTAIKVGLANINPTAKLKNDPTYIKNLRTTLKNEIAKRDKIKSDRENVDALNKILMPRESSYIKPTKLPTRGLDKNIDEMTKSLTRYNKMLDNQRAGIPDPLLRLSPEQQKIFFTKTIPASKPKGMFAGGETTDRIAELTDNVLRPQPMTKKEAMAEAEKMRFLDALEERSPSSGGIDELLMSMATFTPLGRGVQGAKQIANAPKFLKDLYDRRSLYMQMVDDSMRSLKNIMGPSKGKIDSDDLFTRIKADDFDLIQRQRVMDTAYKASRRNDELMNIERQIKSAEKALGNMGDIRKVDAAEEVGKRFMAKSELSTGGLIDALKNIRNK